MTKKETKLKKKKIEIVTLEQLILKGEKSEHENLDLPEKKIKKST